jgi:hypothetical protein
MVQRRDGARFGLESSQPLRISGQSLGQHLDRSRVSRARYTSPMPPPSRATIS